MKKEFSSKMRVRFGDCDPIGHLNNVKFLEYMMNAREDHIHECFGVSYAEHIKNTGSSWVVIENQIAYLREVKPNAVVNISSKIIKIGDRTSVVEILMKDEKNEVTHAVLWVTAIYFNMKLRKSMVTPDEEVDFFSDYLVTIPEDEFEDRVVNFRLRNKEWKES